LSYSPTSNLFSLAMLRMMPAARTVLINFHPSRIIAPILLRGVILLLALSASQRNHHPYCLCFLCHCASPQVINIEKEHSL